MKPPVRISHFSDVLCVWAYASQVRLDELSETYGERLDVQCHFCEVFGDTEAWMAKRWGDRGGGAAYGAHVHGIVDQFDQVRVHADAWTRVRPKSSMPCHLYLVAVRLVGARARDATLFDRTLWAFREAFFRDARDISDAHVRREIAVSCAVPTGEVEALIADGSAHAALSSDLALARNFDVHVSPTYVFDQGRQRLNGNVGYRIIEANVKELLEQPHPAHSWC